MAGRRTRTPAAAKLETAAGRDALLIGDPRAAAAQRAAFVLVLASLGPPSGAAARAMLDLIGTIPH
ncbi:MAG: hypothetical protein ACREFN_19060 [Acetobacteraceae bacterium]